MSVTTLQQSEGDTPPEWIHLLPAGSFYGMDGRGPWRATNPAAIINASMSRGSIPIDENHAIDLAAPKGEPSPARGWIVQMQARADGIWARVAWTRYGDTLLRMRAYRSISPAFWHASDGSVTRILRAALTNSPNLPQLTALNVRAVAQQGANLMAAGDNLPESMRLKPTDAELQIARKMNVDPDALARQRYQREQREMADYSKLSDADKVKWFDSAVAAPTPGPTKNASEAPHGDPGRFRDFPNTALDVARKMGIAPERLAQQRKASLQKWNKQSGVDEDWDGYINWGGSGDPAYQLTDADARNCMKCGVDPQQFLAWKRDPINAPRPRGLPAQTAP